MLYGIIALFVLLSVSLAVMIIFIIKNSNKNILIAEQLKQLNDLTIKQSKLDEENSVLITENTRLKTEFYKC